MTSINHLETYSLTTKRQNNPRLTSIILKPAVSTAGIPKLPPPTSIIYSRHHIKILDVMS